MSVGSVYMLGPCVFAAGQINQITDYLLDPGIDLVTHRGDGASDEQLVAVMQQAPKFGFTTTAIARALGIAGYSGYAIAAASTFFFQKVAQGGLRSGSTTSLKFVGTKGILVPKTLSADNTGLAKLTMEACYISSDGTTAPVVYTPSVAMATPTAADQMFTVGPVKLNGTLVEGIQSISVDFGLDLVMLGGSGEAYPTFNAIKTRKPSITFKTTDASQLNAGYVAQGGTATTVYFRKLAQNGLRTADATAEHIKFTINAGIYTAKGFGGGGSDDVQMTEVMVTPTFDNTNDTLALSAASAIT